MFNILERHYKVLITSLALLLVVGYVHRLWWPHKGEEKFEYGYYAYEKWKEGKMRWTWRKGCMRVKATSDLFAFRVVVQPHNSTGPDGLTFKVFLDGDVLDSVHFFNGGSRFLYYYVPNIEGKNVEIRTEVDRTFNPLRMKINEDGRELGVAVNPITFLKIMPKDGIGFYHWETMDAQSAESMAQSGVGRERRTEDGGQRTEDRRTEDRRTERFRWTGMRASQSIADFGFWISDSKKQNVEYAPVEHPEGTRFNGVKMLVFLRCAHPDIDKEGVVVRILGNRKVIREERFEDHGWKKVEFKGDELQGVEVVTFEVSRTWNPKLMGVSQDNRDLGVAVAVP